jgi:hypothetical protein
VIGYPKCRKLDDNKRKPIDLKFLILKCSECSDFGVLPMHFDEDNGEDEEGGLLTTRE